MARRHGQKMGCCELAVVVFALFVAFQFLALGARVVTELAVFATTLVKWIGLGLAGGLGVVAVVATVYALGRVLTEVAGGFAKTRPRGEARQPSRESYHRQARRWQRGINTTVGRLRRRDWIERDDAKRYRQSVGSAVERIHSLEHDLKTLRSLPASEELADELESVAQTLLSRLERTHRALAKLLAESALQRAPVVDQNLRDSADEVESLVTALQEVSGVGEDVRKVEEELTQQIG